jgi:UDP:flavonoid glycosyltransferase YjiC (YdhE family)
MKALFIPFAPSLAHVSRCLAVAEAWRARGHTAAFAIGPERTAMVQAAGFDPHPVPEVPSAVFRSDQGLRWLTAAYFRQNIEAERAILAGVQPDVIVFDFRFTTRASARLSGVPSASILHGNGLRLALAPHQTAQSLLGDPKRARGANARRLRAMRRLFPLVFQTLMWMAARRVAPILRAHDLPPANSPFELLLDDKVLIADLPTLLPPGLQPGWPVVGPLTWSGWEGPTPWLDELDDRPLIHVTMGSTVEAGSVLVKVVEALRDAPYNGIVSTGGLSLPSDLELPAHIRAFPTVPGATVVGHSAAVVHHGGHGTLMQALAAGVPSLILPANPDQILVAQQAQAFGVGRSLWRPGSLPIGARAWRGVTPAQIRREIDDLIADQDCARTCAAFRQEIEACAGAEGAVDILEDMAVNGRPFEATLPTEQA